MHWALIAVILVVCGTFAGIILSACAVKGRSDEQAGKLNVKSDKPCH